jgi:hypothetical protein
MIFFSTYLYALLKSPKLTQYIYELAKLYVKLGAFPQHECNLDVQNILRVISFVGIKLLT